MSTTRTRRSWQLERGAARAAWAGSPPRPHPLLPVHPHPLPVLFEINRGCIAAGAVETAIGCYPCWDGAAGRTHAHSRQLQRCLSAAPSWGVCGWRPDAGGGGLAGVNVRSEEPVAEAKSRFNIVTLTTYLIDISFFFFFCNVTICGQRRRCRFKKLIFIKCERHSY